ncbi:MAG: hypothetical protein ACQERB_16685 [Promethearchaeati archaeon]
MSENKAFIYNFMNKRQIISLLIIIFLLIVLFIYLLVYGTHLIVAFLIVLFLFLFSFGLIYNSNKISLSKFFSRSRDKYPSSRDRSKKQYKIQIPKTDTPETLKFTYHSPLIRKCPNCGMILTRNMKKCPNCESAIE